MKFIIKKEDLLDPLQKIASVIEKRQIMPILSNVLLVVKGNCLILTVTDLEIQLISSIILDTSEEGEITVPARKFLDIVRLSPNNATLKLELKANKIIIISGRSRFSLSTLAAEDYPEFSEIALENEFVINACTLKNALNKTVFCMGNQDVRYYLNGLLLHISNSKLKLVASDGHRLSFYEDDIGVSTGYETRIILPRKGVLELSRLLNDDKVELTIQFSNSNIRVKHDYFIFSAKLVDAKYPDFSKVYEQSFLNQICIPKAILKDALSRVAILANEKIKGVNCNISSGILKLSSHNPEHDEAEEELIIDYNDTPLSIDFNAQYLLDAVNNLDSEIAILTIASNGSSCFIDEAEPKPYKFIVMPMRL